MTPKKKDRLQAAAQVLERHGPVLRFSEILELGIHRDTLWKMREAGVVEQVSRGLYRLAKAKTLDEPDLVTVAKRVPGAVVCLISALALHDLTTQIPHAVDIALKHGRRRPRLEYPPLRIHWWSAAALTSGVEEHSFAGVRVLVTDPERSVADAFRYRNQLGLDLALEALRTWKGRKGARLEKLLGAARSVRVEKVVRPYLQALT